MLILIFIGVIFNSCAAIFSGSNQMVSLDSEPQGANVYINGENTNQQTPCVVTIKRKIKESQTNVKNEYVYKFEKENFNSYVYRDKSKFYWLAGVDYFFYVVPGIIDLAVGADRKYLNEVHVNLTPLNTNNSQNINANNNQILDKNGPEIVITDPNVSRGFKIEVSSEQINVRGKALDVSGIFNVNINGTNPTINDDGSFQANILLKKGDNKIIVKATDKKQNTSEYSFYVSCKFNQVVNNPNVIENNNNVTNSAITEKRVALIIGNAGYKSTPLRNSVNDANLMALELKKVGFDVTKVVNGTQNQMRKAISDYGTKLSKDKNTIGLFYYAGHGIQVQGQNYIVPVDEKIEKEADVSVYCVDLDGLMKNLEYSGNTMNVVILDACRNNPFGRGFRSQAGTGLATVNAPTGTIIAFATAPGSVASDGDGKNGLYTQEFAKALQIPNIKIEDVFKKVRTQVKTLSNGMQVPWENSSIEGDFYFKKQ